MINQFESTHTGFWALTEFGAAKFGDGGFVRKSMKNVEGEVKTAEQTWRRLDGKNQLPKVITGVKFSDGFEVIEMEGRSAA